jgi:DNA polymerase I-like protein with 3'-5' exonuclease and polymerase domains
MQEKWKREALDFKTVTMPTGFQFYFPHTTITSTGYQTDSTSICNYPVQSFATADIIPIVITYAWHQMRQAGLEGFIVNTIHDSIIVEAPIEEKEKINEIMCRTFGNMCYNYIKRTYNIDFTTTLGVGMKWGKYWSEGPETLINLPNEAIK